MDGKSVAAENIIARFCRHVAGGRILNMDASIMAIEVRDVFTTQVDHHMRYLFLGPRADWDHLRHPVIKGWTERDVEMRTAAMEALHQLWTGLRAYTRK